ncbi:MAG: hypothetical protein K8F91_12045 [Candidatus Obscuribacterales bacterium]|nr:hypothetical protein [Candidatus Obscuribacterales bacterium]
MPDSHEGKSDRQAAEASDGDVLLLDFSPGLNDDEDGSEIIYRRCTDLLVCPESASRIEKLSMGNSRVEDLIERLESEKRTGIIKTSNDRRPSRSGTLLCQGQVVGSFYSSKGSTRARSNEESLPLILKDLSDRQTEVSIYDLSEPIIMAQGALFIGYPLYRNDDFEARPYLDNAFKWLLDKKATATIDVSIETSATTTLAFVHKGRFQGCFFVDTQTFRVDLGVLLDLVDADKDANIQVSFLSSDEFTWTMPKRLSFSSVLKDSVE